MDECTLSNLLECSVCFEQLDTSSKVLPCQHTFCKKCLEEIVRRRKELRCPECRVLVDVTVDELPPNVLLMRILEGLKNAPRRSPSHSETVTSANLTKSSISKSSCNSRTRSRSANRPSSQQVLDLHQPYAIARCDYVSKEPGDLNFKKGDVILLRRKIEHIWYQGECNGVLGVFPLSYVQVIVPLASHVPQCKALYEFGKCHEDDEGCLHFMEGDVITVTRRVDENWAEGKLEDRIGIFPISFVEMNYLAKNVMKNSYSILHMPRGAPPTPVDVAVQLNSGDESNVFNSSPSQGTSDKPTSSPLSPLSSSSSTSTATTSPTSSSESTTPSSPSVSPSAGLVSQTIPIKRHSYTPGALPPPYHAPPAVHRYSAEILAGDESNDECTKKEQAPHGSVCTSQPKTLLSALQMQHSSPIVVMGDSPSAVSNQCQKDENEVIDLNRETKPSCLSSKQIGSNMVFQKQNSCRISKSPLMPSKYVELPALPAVYVAIYPYKPQKTDELELRIGCFYTVMERCQDGWFKGTSHPTQKCGVFPGNYVTPFKTLPTLQTQLIGLVQKPGTPTYETGNISKGTTLKSQTNCRITPPPPSGVSNIDIRTHFAPPELPARSLSPVSQCNVIEQKVSATTWHVPSSAVAEKELSETSATSKHRLKVTKAETSESDLDTNTAGKSDDSPTAKSLGKNKERKEKVSVSLMKRLTSMKKTLSPPITLSSSIDNPVFEDCSSAFVPVSHARADSCPSQLSFTIQAHSVSATNRHSNIVSGSQRLKHKHNQFPRTYESSSSPSVISSSGGRSSKDEKRLIISHRKSSSLNTTLYDERGDPKEKSAEHVSRERYRCVAPYPPNSEFELELKVGDILFVHRKRDDGWYKGTLQRNGRTGLFPANFVEAI